MKRLLLIVLFVLLFQCKKPDDPPGVDYRQAMRDFVVNISKYAKAKNSDFIVIPQNGQELIFESYDLTGNLAKDYLRAIDGTGREDLFYGYNRDNQLTPNNENEYLLNLCKTAESNQVEVLAIDYCSDPDKMIDSYSKNEQNGFISFAAPERSLNVIPEFPQKPYNENNLSITNLGQAKNFLYLINDENYESKSNFINAVSSTNYDLIIMDLFHNEEKFNREEIELLKIKENGSRRLIVAYMSIGEAEDYRYYWDNDWIKNPPVWLRDENQHWKGNYEVMYWNEAWQNIIMGSPDSYLNKILDSGFDGVYLDLIDAFEYFEE